jgi:hypothetical protein
MLIWIGSSWTGRNMDQDAVASHEQYAHLEKVIVVDVVPCGSSAALSVATTSPDLKELACRKAAVRHQRVRKSSQAADRFTLQS